MLLLMSNFTDMLTQLDSHCNDLDVATLHGCLERSRRLTLMLSKHLELVFSLQIIHVLICHYGCICLTCLCVRFVVRTYMFM